MIKNSITINDIPINVYGESSNSVIVIVHGASEGASRYEEFAKLLATDRNVITYNHPGHETGEVVNFEYVSIIETTKQVLKYAEDTYDHVAIFAHSMGSLITRAVINSIKPNTKIILSGAPVVKIGDKMQLSLMNLLLKVCNGDKASKFFNHLFFDMRNDKIGLKNKTWLTTNDEIVEQFKTDALQNQLFNNRSLAALCKLTLIANNNKIYEAMNKHSILLISGMTDVFTNNGLNYQLINNYCENCLVIIYPNSYHEVHNDIDKNQLIKDINLFIKEINGKN